MKVLMLFSILNMTYSAEIWNKDELEQFVSSHIMAEAHHGQITAWGTWNCLDLDMQITASDNADGGVDYSIALPANFVDTYGFVGACNKWSSTEEDLRTRKLVQFQDALNADKTSLVRFTFAKNDQNTSFVAIEGMKDGKHRNFRIWLCGFTGTTAVASLQKFSDQWPRLTSH